jgi:hypothetical protein
MATDHMSGACSSASVLQHVGQAGGIEIQDLLILRRERLPEVAAALGVQGRGEPGHRRACRVVEARQEWQPGLSLGEVVLDVLLDRLDLRQVAGLLRVGQPLRSQRRVL